MPAAYLSPYFVCNGNCREMMEFYQSCMGGKLTMQTYGDVPPQPDMPSLTPEMKSRIMHATLENDQLSFTGCDAHPGKGAPVVGDNIHLSVAGTDETRLREMFKKLAVGGEVNMELAPQFWGDIFGMLKDKFGTHWMFNIAGRK